MVLFFPKVLPKACFRLAQQIAHPERGQKTILYSQASAPSQLNVERAIRNLEQSFKYALRPTGICHSETSVYPTFANVR